MAQYIEFTPEQKERAATVDLEEFLLRQGEKLIKSGREKRLASDHSITVRGCEWFDHASNEGGRAVSFIQKYYGKSYVEAMSMLLGESMGPVYPQVKKQEQVDQKLFAPPVPNANMHRVFAYLLKTRGLDADVVSYFARRKLLYEDAAHHNAVFIGTDEGGCPRHAHLRSTNSFGKAFRLNVESSDPRYSFHHTGTDGSLYVFEAPIDMLSYIHTQEFREAQYDNGNSQEDKSPLFKKFLSAISRWDNYAASTSTGWIEDITDERLAARLKELSQEDLELLTQFIIQGFTQSDLEQMGYGKQYKISRRISRLKNFLKK